MAQLPLLGFELADTHVLLDLEILGPGTPELSRRVLAVARVRVRLAHEVLELVVAERRDRVLVDRRHAARDDDAIEDACDFDAALGPLVALRREFDDVVGSRIA
jgi:hypothetical protein